MSIWLILTSLIALAFLAREILILAKLSPSRNKKGVLVSYLPWLFRKINQTMNSLGGDDLRHQRDTNFQEKDTDVVVTSYKDSTTLVFQPVSLKALDQFYTSDSIKTHTAKLNPTPFTRIFGLFFQNPPKSTFYQTQLKRLFERFDYFGSNFERLRDNLRQNTRSVMVTERRFNPINLNNAYLQTAIDDIASILAFGKSATKAGRQNGVSYVRLVRLCCKENSEYESGWLRTFTFGLAQRFGFDSRYYKIKRYRGYMAKGWAKLVSELERKLKNGETDKDKLGGAGAGGAGLLGALVKLQREQKGTKGEEIGIDDIGVFLETLIWGVSEKLSSALSSIFALLVTNPKIFKKLKEEISIFHNNPGYSLNDLNSNQYLDALIKECLRFVPTVGTGVTRVVTKNGLKICEAVLNKGDLVSVPYVGLGMNLGCFEDWMTLNPERYLQQEGSFQKDVKKLSPFGVGRASCPFEDMAMSLIKLVLVEFLASFEIRRVYGWRMKLEQKAGSGLYRVVNPLVLAKRRKSN